MPYPFPWLWVRGHMGVLTHLGVSLSTGISTSLHTPTSWIPASHPRWSKSVKLGEQCLALHRQIWGHFKFPTSPAWILPDWDIPQGAQSNVVHPTAQRLKRAAVSQWLIVHNSVCPKFDPFSIAGDPVGMSIYKWTDFGTELLEGRIQERQRMV